MPKTAIISDIHANLHALSAVIADVQEQACTDIVCLGDIVGYNAYPSECLDYIRNLNCPIVKGNHDQEVASPSEQKMNAMAKHAMEWTQEMLSDDQKDWLRKLPYKSFVRSSFALVHASSDQPQKWNYILNTNDAAANFGKQLSPICFHGHTHVPRVFYLNSGQAGEDTALIDTLRAEGEASFAPVQGVKYFVNVGSVGQPRDNDPRACYAIYDTDVNLITLRRVTYDIASAQHAIRAAGLPEYLAERLQNGV